MKRRIVLAAALLGVAACSADADQRAASTSSTVELVDSTAVDASRTVPAATDGPAATPVDTTVDTTVETSAAPETSATSTPIPEVPETGVPGLDSDDAFCAAWSRFGGSWQVLSVGSSFLGDPERIAMWEIAASPVIEQAFADLLEYFPEQLASEATTVAEGYFGALQRRSGAARAALGAAGADAEAVQRLGQAWVEALAVRDPFDPDLAFGVADDLQPVVDRAVDEFRSQRVEFHLDPSMVVGVDTPLTDAYLVTACPDQGTLSGQEVVGG